MKLICYRGIMVFKYKTENIWSQVHLAIYNTNIPYNTIYNTNVICQKVMYTPMTVIDFN